MTRTVLLGAAVTTAFVGACVIALLVVMSQKAEAAFPGRNGDNSVHLARCPALRNFSGHRPRSPRRDSFHAAHLRSCYAGLRAVPRVVGRR
jgi:hypothetical protein